MAHQETPHVPRIKEMSIEEKWDRLHLTHPNHPSARMEIVPTEVTWEEGGCVWTFKTG